MSNIESEFMSEDEVFVEGISFYVYYDYILTKDTDFGVQPGYEITLRQAFNTKGEPVEPNEYQRARIEEILADRLKNGEVF